MSKSREIKKLSTTFDDSIGDDDFGLILSKKGELKGLWIPTGQEDSLVPIEISAVLMKYWGVDPNAPDAMGETLH